MGAAIAQKDNEVNWRTMGGNNTATLYEVRKDFYKHWEDKVPTKGQGYSVFRRWETYMLPRVYPSGDMTLPSTTYNNYMKWLRSEGNSSATQRSATSNWSSLGPNVVPSGYDSGAGRVDFVRFDPTNSNTLYIGAPDGGLWKSVNGGTSWTTNTDFLGVIGCADLAIDPDNTQNMYLATGNWETDRSSIGVLKSTDGGATWSATSLAWNPSDSYEIRRMVMDTANPLIMMVVTDGGLFRTTDGWATNSVTNLDGDYNLYDIKFKPGSSSTLYASGKTGLNTNVFWKSTDSGASWTAVTSGLPSSADVSRIIIGVTPDDDTYVYLLAGNADNGYKGLYRSTNSGTSFSTQSTTPNLLQSDKDGVGTGGQANHDLAIAVAPNNKDKVTIGGINQWRSTNGGVDWTIFTYWLGDDPAYPGEGDASPPYTHADIQDIQYLPGSSTTMFTTADGGIYKTTDDGATWATLSNNLSIAQQNNVVQSATTEGLLVTGLQDIGTIMKSGGSWSVINGGDGESGLIDRTNDMVIITSNPNGAHAISTDGGLNRSDITGLPNGLLFFSPIIQDPVTATTIYAGGRSALYKNVDFVNNPNTWVTLGTPPESTSDGAIMRFVVAPSNPSIIYVIKGNEVDATTLSKSTDGGSSFVDITGTLPTTAQMTNLAVSNTDADKVWVTYSGYVSGTKVYRTSDGGTSWENMSGGLPNLPMNTIVYVNNSVNDELYLGSDIGIYHYNNTFDSFAPGNWTIFNTNLPNSRVTDLQVFYPTSKLRASTYGRGMWETAISIALPVELSSFSGKNRGNENRLFWTTLTENNLDYYSIERSKDGRNFEAIGKVRPASANSLEPMNYDFTDASPLAGINYYRLKIMDLDLKFEYTKIILLLVEDKDSPFVLFPNPTSDQLELKGLTADDEVTIRLMDASGRSIRSEQLSGNSQIDVSDLSNGTYFIEIVSEERQTVVKQFVKQ